MGTRVGWEAALEVWDRRKWLAIVVFSLGSCTVASIAHFLPDVYRSTATVLVERYQIAESFVRPSVTVELDTRLQTISQETLSRSRLAELVTRFGLYPELVRRVPMEAVVERVRKDIQLELKSVEQPTGRGATVAFTLSYRGREPQTVAAVANTLASFYVEQNSRLRERQATETTEALRGQVDDLEKRLAKQEQRIRDFRARHVGELPQQLAVNLATLERLTTRLQL